MLARIRDDIDESFVMQDKSTNKIRRLAIAKELPGRNTLFEYACSPDSNLSQFVKEIGINRIRLSFDIIDLSDPQHGEQLHGQESELKEADIWMSLPYIFHCQWQSLNLRKGGSESKKRLKAKQRHLENILAKSISIL